MFGCRPPLLVSRLTWWNMFHNFIQYSFHHAQGKDFSDGGEQNDGP